jgi:hypothetical protein
MNQSPLKPKNKRKLETSYQLIVSNDGSKVKQVSHDQLAKCAHLIASIRQMIHL